MWWSARQSLIKFSAMSRYFSESEFKKCVPSCSERDMDGAFLSLFDEARERDNTMQGVVYNNGKLLMPFGYGNATYPGQLLAIDVEAKKIASKVDLSFINGEPAR